MIYVDTDNALGSPAGDVDDGFALAALMCAGAPIAAIASIFGNTREGLAAANNRRLAQLCGSRSDHLRGAASARDGVTPAAWYLATGEEPVRVLALGPLTNLARALEVSQGSASRLTEVIIVGGNLSSRGRWPPLWPHDFNLTLDPGAVVSVFTAAPRLTVVPLDVARRLAVSRADLALLGGPIGDELRQHSQRWLRRAHWLRLSSSIRLYDLVAAAYVLDPHLVSVKTQPAQVHRNGWIAFGPSGRSVEVLTDFDPSAVWARFVQIINAHGSGEPRRRPGA